MVEPQASIFWQMALRSGLIDPPRLQECWDAVPPERRTVDAIDRHLAQRAVKAGYLTSWQAQQILLGRADHLRIHKYTLLDLIGEGGMGRVYLALDTRLNRGVALKILSSNRLNHERAIKRFQREARLGAQLQHENLVRIYDEGEANGCSYLVMEYIEGKSVDQLLTEYGPMPAPTAARLVFQVALGLEHARQKGMIHRDINPRNILVTREGIAKLADLGLAIAIGDEKALTLDGAFVGTYKFRALARESHATLVAVDEAIVGFNHGVAFWPQPLRPGPVLLDSMLASPRSPLSCTFGTGSPSRSPSGHKVFENLVLGVEARGPLVKHQPHEGPFKYPGICQVVPGTLGKWLQGSRTSPMGRTKGPSRAGRVDPARQRSHRA